jgi:hypothetical protein
MVLEEWQSYRLYGPKVIAWTGMPDDDALNSRCVVIAMQESSRPDLLRTTDPEMISAANDLQGQPRLARKGSLQHDNSVHYYRMKNVTLSADENLIEQARLIAKAQRKTLNSAFREWLEQFTRQSGNAQEFDSLMKRLKHVRPGRRFTRDEMNER